MGKQMGFFFPKLKIIKVSSIKKIIVTEAPVSHKGKVIPYGSRNHLTLGALPFARQSP